MDNEIYLIHLDDYLNHIDSKLEMYDLLLELVEALRKDLAEGETAQAVRTLCSYEQQAHLLFESWSIPDTYMENFGDLDCLSGLMEKELLPANDGDEDDLEEDIADDMDDSISARLLRVVTMLNQSARNVLDVTTEIVDFEEEIDRLLNDGEGPENDCAD